MTASHAAGLEGFAALPLMAMAHVNSVEIFKAAQHGDTARVRSLIDQGVDADITDQYGRTALMVAAQAGHSETVRLLLRLGANVDARNELRSTSLMLATLSGKADVAALLIDNGADVNAQALNGLTALMLAAASREQGSLEIVKLLVAHNSDLNIADNNGRTALMYSIISAPPPPPPPPDSDNALKRWYREVEDGRANQAEICKVLIKAGSDLSAKDHEGNTAETLANAYQQREILELLRRSSSVR